jgi:hypothetical protein
MKMKNIFYAMFFTVGALTLASCNDFLDVMPDNRATVDSEEKIAKLLVSAYPGNSPQLLWEFGSDDHDDQGSAYVGNNRDPRELTEVNYWMDNTEVFNDGPTYFWGNLYLAIANANLALDAIANLGTPESLLPYKGEALLCRAYTHFILVNTFCKPYNPETSASDLGIPYMTHSETELNPQYDRDNVAHVYELMEKDILEGLPLLNDGLYGLTARYHFTTGAASAFAARFYLTYWDAPDALQNVVKYATAALGSSPATILTDWARIESDALYDEYVTAEQYVAADRKHNLLLLPSISIMGTVYGGYY